MSNRHPLPLKKSKSLVLFWIYQVNSTANSATWPIFAVNRLNWQCSLAGSSAPRILIFSMAMGADYLFEGICIETYAPQFIGHNKLFLGSVKGF